jgi:hypothetical protein
MREPDVVYMLEITEFERPHCRTEEAVYEWFADVAEQRECLFWSHWVYHGVLWVYRRPARAPAWSKIKALWDETGVGGCIM